MKTTLAPGRGKDFARLVTFMEADATDEAKLNEILERHGLGAAWKRFAQNYLNPQ